MKISIDLVANTATFTTDLQRASKTAEREAKRIQAEFSKLGTAIGVGIVAAAGSAVIALKSVIDGADELSKAAQKIGIGTEALSGLAYAADLSGVSFEALTGSLAKFNRQVIEAVQGGKSQAEAFTAVGVSLDDLKNKSPEQLLLQVSRAFAATEDGAKKTAAAMALFGKSGADLIPLLNEGEDGIKQLTDEARALGVVIGDNTASAAEQFNDNLSRLQASAKGLTLSVANELLPALVDVTNGLVDFVKAASASGAIQTLAEAIAGLIQNLDVLAVYLASRLAFAAVAAAIGAFTGAVGIATVAVAGFNAVLALLGGPVGLLALAAASIYYFATSESEAEKATKALQAAQASLNGQSQETQQAALNNALAIRQETLARLESLKAAAKQAPFTAGIGGKREREEATAELDALDVTITELQRSLAGEFTEATKSAADGIKLIPTVAKVANTELKALESALQDALKVEEDSRKTLTDLNTELSTQVATFGLSESAALAYRLTLGDLSDEVDRLGASGRATRDEILKNADALGKQKAAQDAANQARANANDLAANARAFERQLADVGAGPAGRRFNAGVGQIAEDVAGRRNDIEGRLASNQIDQGQYEKQLAALTQYQSDALAQWNDYYVKLEERNADFGLQFQDALKGYVDGLTQVGAELGNTIVGAIDSATEATARLAAETLLWGQGGLEAAKAIGRSLINEVVQGFIQAGIKSALFYTLNKAGIISTTAVSTAAQATTAATATASNATIAASAAPAAALTSLASFGSNAIPAAIGIALVAGAIGALLGGAFADGGMITGPGTGKSDSILAKVSNGEFVMTADAVNRMGPDFFESINKGRMPAFADGGLVGSSAIPPVPRTREVAQTGSNGGSTNVRIINVTDTKMIEDYIGSGAADEVIFNRISRNGGKLSAIVRNS